MSKYSEIFNLILEGIINNSTYSRETVLSRFEPFNNFHFEDFSEEYLYHVLAYVPFYAGMSSKVVTNKRATILKYFDHYNEVAKYDEIFISKILLDSDMISHQGKIRASIHNAQKVKGLAVRHGSFKNYLRSLDFNRSEDHLEKAAVQLINQFEWLGEVTVHHFLTDIGAKTIKPDRVIMRVFSRLNIVENSSSFKKAREICDQIVKETGYSHRYIDIILVKFGHLEDDMDTGIKNGICTEKDPKCSKCLLAEHCFYNKEKSFTAKTELADIEYSIPKSKNPNLQTKNTKNILTKEQFLKNNLFLSQGTNLQGLLKYLMLGMDSKNIKYNVKIRKDASIAFTATSSESNIITIWLYNRHLRLLILNVEDEKCSSARDIDNLLNKINNKYINVR